MTTEDAPVGFEVPGREWARVDGEAQLVEVLRPARVHDGRLYVQVMTPDKEPVPADGAEALDAIFHTGHDGMASLGAPESLSDAQGTADAEASRYLSVDGQLWRATGEPVYQISTYGLGGNYGGTSLSAEFLPERAPGAEHALDEFYYPADQHEAAIAGALRVAEERGDTRSLELIRDTPAIQVTGEMAPASTYRAATRLDYPEPSAFTFADDPDGARRAFDQFKAQLMTVPGAVVEIDDGWGGKTKSVNRRALTERQASDYDRYVQLTSTVDAPL